MHEYRKVAPTFWTGSTGKLIRAQGQEAQIIAMYLVTCHNANMIGLYYLPLPTLVHETGIPFEGASKGLRSLKDAGFALYDEPSETVFVPRMAAWQLGDTLKTSDNNHKGLLKQLAYFRKSCFFKDFHSIYKDVYHLPPLDFFKAPSEGLPRGLEAPTKHRDRDRDREREGEGENTPPPPKGEDDLFSEFWFVFPKGRKTGKSAAQKAWKAAVKKERPEKIIASAREYAASPVGNGPYVKGPVPWLNQGCWDDDRAAWSRSENGQAPRDVAAEMVKILNKEKTDDGN